MNSARATTVAFGGAQPTGGRFNERIHHHEQNLNQGDSDISDEDFGDIDENVVHQAAPQTAR